jgi:hypothetical protein
MQRLRLRLDSRRVLWAAGPVENILIGQGGSRRHSMAIDGSGCFDSFFGISTE